MNTNPDEITLALWLDDELSGDELAAVEAWAVGHPEQLVARENIRAWRANLRAAMPAVEEPPYPDFFNSRILQAIQTKPVTAAKPRTSIWRSWLMPATACAGMMLAYWAGTTKPKAREYDVSNAPRAIPVEPLVYAPEQGVDAEIVSNSKVAATVIVLRGLTAIPDSTDFSATADYQQARESDSTADIESHP